MGKYKIDNRRVIIFYSADGKKRIGMWQNFHVCSMKTGIPKNILSEAINSQYKIKELDHIYAYEPRPIGWIERPKPKTNYLIISFGKYKGQNLHTLKGVDCLQSLLMVDNALIMSNADRQEIKQYTRRLSTNLLKANGYITKCAADKAVMINEMILEHNLLKANKY